MAVLDNDGNMILTEGFVLQDEKIWKRFLDRDIIPKSNSCELYFEERDDVGKIIEKYNGNMIEGGKKSNELIDDCLEKEICFTQETTLSEHGVFNTVKKAIDKGYYIRLYYVGLNTVEESILRIENCVKKGGHNIADADVIRRFDKRFEDLMTILPYCDEATFYDNENGFVAVAEYKNGEIMQIGSSRPQWLKKLMENVV